MVLKCSEESITRTNTAKEKEELLYPFSSSIMEISKQLQVNQITLTYKSNIFSESFRSQLMKRKMEKEPSLISYQLEYVDYLPLAI